MTEGLDLEERKEKLTTPRAVPLRAEATSFQIFSQKIQPSTDSRVLKQSHMADSARANSVHGGDRFLMLSTLLFSQNPLKGNSC